MSVVPFEMANMAIIEIQNSGRTYLFFLTIGRRRSDLHITVVGNNRYSKYTNIKYLFGFASALVPETVLASIGSRLGH